MFQRKFAVMLAALALSGISAFAVVVADDDIRRDATVRVIEQVMPSVVNIATETVVPVQDPFEAMFRRFYGQQPTDTMTSLGSGVIIDENGYLLTNDHVVRRARKIAVKFNTGTNVYEAKIVDSDSKRDVALLKLVARPGEKFRAIRMAREDDLLLGESVLALGNPFGLGGSVARGILSSKNRTMPKEGAPLDIPNWLQTDAPINPGNSGGPLVNLRGELIGINVAVLNEYEGQPVQGIGFAIPIRLVQEALGDILPTDVVKSYWFGARVRVGSYPLVITSVQPDSPAGRAGLRTGDTVLQVNGTVPRSIIEFADLLVAKPRSDVALTIRRNGENSEMKVRLVPDTAVFNADLIREKIGLELNPVARGNSVGFIVAHVESGSPAGEAGLQKNMVITAVDDQIPGDIKSFAKMLHEKKKGEAVTINVVIPLRSGFWQRGTAELTTR
ncbi:MAG TPA: trypsin-like peptidase domain-containing protein [Candidatus Paceibacterota bacterium]|nr:trypsin-like peptidase domain-containing protein [Candidatus Paceibacterota bacterium]